MKKYIKLHHYVIDYSSSAGKKLCPILIDTEQIKLVIESQVGAIIYVDVKAQGITVVESIEVIENLLNTKQE